MVTSADSQVKILHGSNIIFKFKGEYSICFTDQFLDKTKTYNGPFNLTFLLQAVEILEVKFLQPSRQMESMSSQSLKIQMFISGTILARTKLLLTKRMYGHPKVSTPTKQPSPYPGVASKPTQQHYPEELWQMGTSTRTPCKSDSRLPQTASL